MGTDRDRDVVGLTRPTHLCCVSPIKFQCWQSSDVFGILIGVETLEERKSWALRPEAGWTGTWPLFPSLYFFALEMKLRLLELPSKRPPYSVSSRLL